jgi:4-hydroxy-tetrahydrodipicolinate synthase
MNKFRGTGVAIVTPFINQEIDFDSLGRVIEHVIEGGVDYIVALGSTGETATLDEVESRQILEYCIAKINKRVPLVAGNFGSNNTKDVVSKIKNYDFFGIDAILSSSPAYVKPTQEGIYQHYIAMAEASPVPIIIYNVPGRTQSNIEWETTVRLANASPKFIGIKEASGNLIQATRIVKNRPEGFLVISGDDEVTLPMIACGGDGVISVIANAFPIQFSEMVRHALADDFVLSRKENLSIYDLHKWLYIEGNPVGIKSAMKHLGITTTNEVRLPLFAMSKGNYAHLSDTLDRISKVIDHALV